MKCPVCQTPDLIMTSRENVEIDYCPQCRGVWLDRGELDKILERSAREAGGTGPAVAAGPAPQAPPPQATHGYMPPPPQQRPYKLDDSDVYPAYGHGHPHPGYGYKHKRKKHWLLEIFD